MVNFGALSESIFLEGPLNLLFLAPHDVPILAFRLFPFAAIEGFEDAVSEGGFEFYVLAVWGRRYGGVG